MSLTEDERAALSRADSEIRSLVARQIQESVFLLKAKETGQEVLSAIGQIAREHGPEIARAALSLAVGIAL